mgnify:CR=1 FL=1
MRDVAAVNLRALERDRIARSRASCVRRKLRVTGGGEHPLESEVRAVLGKFGEIEMCDKDLRAHSVWYVTYREEEAMVKALAALESEEVSDWKVRPLQAYYESQSRVEQRESAVNGNSGKSEKVGP